MHGLIKRVPMLFVGGKGSITHMHFDIELSPILHTQFIGRKRVLLFPFDQQLHLYRKPFEVLSFADFSYYYDAAKSKVDYNQFPRLRKANGFECTLEHGDTLFMPGGYWHHMAYLDRGFAMSLMALHRSLGGKIKGAWNIIGMRNWDTLFKKIAPDWWYRYKKEKVFNHAGKRAERLTA